MGKFDFCFEENETFRDYGVDFVLVGEGWGLVVVLVLGCFCCFGDYVVFFYYFLSFFEESVLGFV